LASTYIPRPRETRNSILPNPARLQTVPWDRNGSTASLITWPPSRSAKAGRWPLAQRPFSLRRRHERMKRLQSRDRPSQPRGRLEEAVGIRDRCCGRTKAKDAASCASGAAVHGQRMRQTRLHVPFLVPVLQPAEHSRVLDPWIKRRFGGRLGCNMWAGRTEREVVAQEKPFAAPIGCLCVFWRWATNPGRLSAANSGSSAPALL
jgi:hypothetical protein